MINKLSNGMMEWKCDYCTNILHWLDSSKLTGDCMLSKSFTTGTIHDVRVIIKNHIKVNHKFEVALNE